MKERPIIFSGEMVRAILDGRKTQTRRVVKPQPRGDFNGPHEYEQTRIGRRGDEYPGPTVFGIHDQDGEWGIVCPYGQTGDRLWVRETWAPTKQSKLVPIAEATYACFPDGSQKFKSGEYCPEPAGRKLGPWPTVWKWRPSIHMPRWASRITLEITSVRVERLNEISEEDAIAEGYPGTAEAPWSPRAWYMSVWRAINGWESWDANPWVWALTFKQIGEEAAA